MALFFPGLDKIDFLKVKPTAGEKEFLYFLNSFLDDTYEVYFQPLLNGDNPDIIILRENSGVMIVEVKDWDLKSYQLSPNRHWQLKNIDNKFGDKQVVKSPIQQVFEYKVNLYNLHIETLLEKRIKNPKFLNIVTCAVYFHKASKKEIDYFLTDGNEDNESYLKFLSHFELLGYDSLINDNFKKIISKRWLDRKSYLFDEELYKSFKRYLKPPTHSIEQGKVITYTDEQIRIIESKAGSQQKIKGVAGSGKTLALAKRAVNAHLRHKGEVLILTFNISLRNYIHDRISEIRENFEWKNFTILHYHHFIKSHNNNVNFLKIDKNQSIKPEGKTYQTIIIDEIQDFQRDWILNVKMFLEKDGEFVVYGDEKQNIYQRTLEDKKPYTSIGRQWNILKKSFRVTTDIANLATQFQKKFFTQKYDYDEIIVQRSLFDKSLIKYHYLDTADISAIMNIYNSIINETSTHDNDVCFQSSRVEVLRLIDKDIRDRLHKKTNTMFETLEVYEKLKTDYTKDGKTDEEKLKKELEIVRRNKKFNFWMNSGTTKLSTIHSFKGWEIATLFLIVENESDEELEFTTDELIYTAITRCRQNLVIINIGNKRYDDFFITTIKKDTLDNNYSMNLLCQSNTSEIQKHNTNNLFGNRTASIVSVEDIEEFENDSFKKSVFEDFKSIKIGNQIWMAENLNVDRFRNGDYIIEDFNNEEYAQDWSRFNENEIPTFCEHTHNNKINHGKFYNVYSVNDERGLAPIGWRIPNYNDWLELIQFLGGKNIAGKKLKSTEFWNKFGNGSNESKFNGLPSGSCNKIGYFYDYKISSSWWSTFDFEMNCNPTLTLFSNTNQAEIFTSFDDFGYFVRCIKENNLNNE